MLGLYIALGVIGLLFILFWVMMFIVHYKVFYSPHKGQNNDYVLTDSTHLLGKDDLIYKLITDLRNTPCEHVYTKSRDHIKLHSRLYRNVNSDTVVIMCHGYRGTAIRDFSGGATHMIEKGYNVLLIDERGHGDSKGHCITFGNKEKSDILCWIDFAKKEFGENIKIVLIGMSMGAATLLFASKYIKEPLKIICDSPYSTEREIIRETIKMMKLNVKFFYPIVNLSSILISHASLNKDDGAKNVKESNHKFLIIHGNSDTMVPQEFSYRVYLENKEKVQYEVFDNTDHGLGYITDKKRYLKLIDDFMNN